MPAMPVEFWFEFASTYSYLAAQRIESLARPAGIPVIWRPFLLGPVFLSLGWNDSPFNIYPPKGRYMWRDLARLCAKYGLPFRVPSQFPRNGLHAARVTLAAANEPWLPDFVRAVLRANFGEDRDISQPAVIQEILSELGVAPELWLEGATREEIKTALRRQTERATELGIFGAPTFLVGSEMFWGNDRLEDALAWAIQPQPPG
ncbi:MAG: 2-hydroxychromene-2-carboxylate isomerase [Zoogloeaceae bacterium]|nr:2-hydroxychromene-2-carboxylate isomerase [Zoogloeaceae bacterium]